MGEHTDLEASDDLELSIRAASSAYAALAGIWFVLGFLYVLAGIPHGQVGNGGALVSFTVGGLWVFWLRGFRLTVRSNSVAYRDGFYRLVLVPIDEISAIRNTWTKWSFAGRDIRIPRLVIDYGVDRHLIVNTKPFARRDIASAIDLIRRRGQL